MNEGRDRDIVEERRREFERSDAGARAQDYAERGREQAQEYGERGREMASEMTSRGQEAAGQAADGAASGMERAATALRERADGDGTQGKVAAGAADRMEQAAGYLREGDAQQMWEDIERFVQEHPLQAAAAAVGAGFIVGRILR